MLLGAAGAGWLLTQRGDGGSTGEAPRAAPLRLGLPINPAELDQAGLTRALDLARRAGVTELNAGVAWWYVSAGRPRGSYDWRALDRLIDAAKASGMRVRLQLSGTPDAVHPEVANAVPDPDRRVWYPPRTPAQLQLWGQFVHATVDHFHGRVSSFEMWNEPNIEAFWRPAPAPGEYAWLLAESYRSAKQASSSAKVVFGGLSHNDFGYLQRYYAEARRLFPDAATHGIFFDLLDVHPYTDGRSPDDTSPDTVVQGLFGAVDKSFPGLRLMKAVMDRNEGGRGSGGKAVVVGEYGFRGAPAGLPAVVPDRRRAYFLKRAVASAGGMPFVSSLSWYGFLPDSGTPANWAIVTEQGEVSWTYQALADLAARREPVVRLPDPAGLRPGPAVIRPVLDGVGTSAVIHTELYVDGVLEAEADGPAVRWTGPRRSTGQGEAQLVVYTRDRHAWPSNIVTMPAGG